jgi:protein phosphatase
MTIGAFARAARLSPKALRLYDERGILRPAWVDPDSGYRFYRRDQLEHARLVAWLRRLGMPLSRIPRVCALEPGAAAEEVAAYWRGVRAEVAALGDVAALLVDHLSRKDESMTGTGTMTLRSAAMCDGGTVRESNQDVAYAGEHLLAVADGFGVDSGAPMSVAAIRALRAFDAVAPGGELLSALEDAADSVESAVRSAAGEGRKEPGTTLTALLWSGSRVGLLHAGDSRAYLLRGR